MAKAKQFEMLTNCTCDYPHGLTYQKCRFCGNGWPSLDRLWKYSVRHYICDTCLVKALEKRPMSAWSDMEEKVYSVITGQLTNTTENPCCDGARFHNSDCPNVR